MKNNIEKVNSISINLENSINCLHYEFNILDKYVCELENIPIIINSDTTDIQRYNM